MSDKADIPVLDREQLEKYLPAALVTGASSGIGESYAKILAAAGFDLLLVARRLSRLEALADSLESEHGISVTTLEADLADPNAIELIAQAAAELDIGLVINNAGYRIAAPFHEIPYSDIEDMIRVNAVAPTLLAHRMMPGLLKREGGGMLFTGSIEALMGFPASSVYAACKAMIHSLGEGLWGETLSTNIDVLVLEPSATDTENLHRQPDATSVLDSAMHPDEVATLGLAALGQEITIQTGHPEGLEMIRSVAKMPRKEGLRLLTGGGD